MNPQHRHTDADQSPRAAQALPARLPVRRSVRLAQPYPAWKEVLW